MSSEFQVILRKRTERAQRELWRDHSHEKNRNEKRERLVTQISDIVPADDRVWKETVI